MFFTKKKKTQVPLREHRRIVGQLREEIRRKDCIIKELRDKNELILTSSIRQAKRNDEILEIVKKLRDRMEKKGNPRRIEQSI